MDGYFFPPRFFIAVSRANISHCLLDFDRLHNKSRADSSQIDSFEATNRFWQCTLKWVGQLVDYDFDLSNKLKQKWIILFAIYFRNQVPNIRSIFLQFLFVEWFAAGNMGSASSGLIAGHASLGYPLVRLVFQLCPSCHF